MFLQQDGLFSVSDHGLGPGLVRSYLPSISLAGDAEKTSLLVQMSHLELKKMQLTKALAIS
jgi:hypothetical protein